MQRLRDLVSGPIPQFVRIGVRNKGCAGLSYHLEYVDNPGKFDEVVEQDGVKVLIDSRALFSIIGSEMDWQEDAIRFVSFLVSVSYQLLNMYSLVLNLGLKTLTSRTRAVVESRLP